MVEDCIFCKIVRKEIPCYKIYEDEEFLVFLDAFPLVKGQTLVVSKNHLDYLFNIEDKIYTKLMILAKKIAKAIDKSLKPIKTGMIVEGLEIAHVHVKLYPLNTGFINLKPILKLSDKEMKKIAEEIKKALR